MTRDKHYIEFSIAKGVLIVLMVIGHSGAPELFVSPIYLFHMPCFFFISGCLFKEKYLQDIPSFIKRKVKSLWIPFVKWGFIFLLLHNLFYHLNIYRNSYSIKEHIFSAFKILTMTGNEQLLGGFWFLKELLYASIISIVILKLLTLTRKRLNNRDLIVSIFLFVGLAYFTSIAPFKVPTISSNTILATAYFITGYTFHQINSRITNYFTFGIIGFMALLFVSTFFNGSMNIKGCGIFLYFTLSIIGSISVIYLSKCIGGGGMRILDYIGKKTLMILVFHFLAFKIVSLFIILIHNLPIKNLSNFPIIYYNNYYWIIYTIMGVAVPLLIDIFIEKLKTLFILIFNKNSFITNAK